MGSRSILVFVQRCSFPMATPALFPAGRCLDRGVGARFSLTCIELPAGSLKLQLLPLHAAPHGLLCSWALGKVLINTRKKTPTAAFRFFLAAEAKSQEVSGVVGGDLPRVTPLLKTSCVPYALWAKARILSVRNKSPCDSDSHPGGSGMLASSNCW